MTEPETISLLVAEIYDAALDTERWPVVLRQVCEYVGGKGLTLFAHDTARPHATMFFNHGHDPHYLQLYTEKYIHMNPLMPAVTFPEVGRVFTIGELVPFNELEDTRFYAEFQKPQGIIDSMFVNLDKSGTSNITMAMIASLETGIFDAEKQRRFALLVPHLRRSVAIGHLIAGHEAEKAVLSSAFNRISFAVFMVDGRGQIVFTNNSATQMLQDGSVLRTDGGILKATSQHANQTLAETIAASETGDSAVGSSGVAIALTASKEERWLAHVLPLTSGSRRTDGSRNLATAAIFVREVGLDTTTPLETLAKLYKLTASEVRVLRGVIDVGGIGQIAESLGIGEPTVKTHVQSLFAKFEVNRQADLVRIVAEHINPFESN